MKEYTDNELQKIRRTLLDEFRESDRGRSTSLTFAKHAIPDRPLPEGKKARAIVIGGSNISTADAVSENSSITFSALTKDRLPVFTSKDIFFDVIKDHVPADTEIIGLNFAFPLEPAYRDGRLDGILIKGTKEHTFSDLTGFYVGKEIESFLGSTGKKLKVITANDTVCLVLAGLEVSPPRGLVGGVIGTGFNFGFFSDERTVVNLESGNFNNFPVTECGKIIDSRSENPGSQLWEKEVSGAYLYQHYNILAKEQGLRNDLADTAELHRVALSGDKGASLARQIFDRSASLVAVQIAAIYDFLENMHLHIVIEGSLYWKGWSYSASVNKHLENLGLYPENITIHKIQNSSILGAGRLAFLA